ncbi:YraN family protein [Trueperella bialowiezensis]|uniref:UPF0102 protein NCTC13354_00377 n=1 Tax=Trueperella bialowiezensis TaxID=312285 RepID=A0A3S4UY18_9ACTO|nr:YraN family protein [Trueperella bialowiezensis]VEI12688.1 Uncharacterised protein family UPF0102 [Trueperella bialowiezensis]
MTIEQMTKNELGAWGENLAVKHLKDSGWAILERNWRTRGGELDIVAFDPQRGAIVAVEVRTRRTRIAGTAEESVTYAKVNRLRGLLLSWLVQRGSFAAEISVDVIAVAVGDDGLHTISHVTDVTS